MNHDFSFFEHFPANEGFTITQFGDMNTGKSTYTRDLMQHYLEVRPNNGILVFDPNKDRDYANLNLLRNNQINKWQTYKEYKQQGSPIRVVRIHPVMDAPRDKRTESFNEILRDIHESVNNALVVFEDILSFVGNNPTDTFKMLIRGNRKKGNVLLFNVHSYNDTPRIIYECSQAFVIRHITHAGSVPTKVAGLKPYFTKAMQEIESQNALITLHQKRKKLPIRPYAETMFLRDEQWDNLHKDMS